MTVIFHETLIGQLFESRIVLTRIYFDNSQLVVPEWQLWRGEVMNKK